MERKKKKKNEMMVKFNSWINAATGISVFLIVKVAGNSKMIKLIYLQID